MAVAALAGAAAMAALPAPADPATPVIRVDASRGSDAGDGSAAKPFATIERAKQETARLKKRPDFAGVTVELEGVFDFPKGGVWLLKGDGGRPGAPVEWRAGPRGATVTGSQRIKASEFRPVADPQTLARLHPAARGQVKALDLRARGIELKKLGDQFVAWNDCELYASDGAKPLARYPNDGWLTMAKIVDRGVAAIDMSKGIEFNKGIRGGPFEYAPDEAFGRWSDADGVWPDLVRGADIVCYPLPYDCSHRMYSVAEIRPTP